MVLAASAIGWQAFINPGRAQRVWSESIKEIYGKTITGRRMAPSLNKAAPQLPRLDDCECSGAATCVQCEIFTSC